jgi:PAS domain S-box-containing protein
MLESARILVVDDEKIIREGCARILRKAGHTVDMASDGQMALDMISAQTFHMVLLDIKMPELDGMQVMDVLRQKQSDLLILVITGYATIETAVEAMKAGAYDLLLKPFSADALRISVTRALDHLRLAKEMEQLRLEQTRSLRDIANEQSRVRTIMNSMDCGILVTDNEKQLVLVNPSAPQMLNLDSSALVGRPMADVVPQKELMEMIDQLFSGQECYTALERELQTPDGLWLRARAAPVRDGEANILGAVTVLQDITVMKQMDQMKNEFVTMVSHELKAPLAAIQQQINVLLEGIAGEINERQQHFLVRAETRAQGLINLINELLDISRIEAGRIVSEQGPLDLVPVLRHVVDFVRPQAEHKGQQIFVETPDSLPCVSADPRNMDEVFINVINNAIKYTPENGRIDVSADRVGDHVRITVADTGYGIPKEDIPKIFDKFYRVKNEKTRSISGTGLGLPIVKGIVEAHLGTIKVESQLGHGTTFSILLPVLTDDNPNTNPVAP